MILKLGVFRNVPWKEWDSRGRFGLETVGVNLGLMCPPCVHVEELYEVGQDQTHEYKFLESHKNCLHGIRRQIPPKLFSRLRF